MKKLLSISYSPLAFNIAMLVLRIGGGVLMMSHGYSKLVNFQKIAPDFMNFLGMGGTVSLALVVFAEFFCAIFIILGLFTRFAAIPLVIDMAIAVSEGHQMKIFTEGEKAALFFLIFFVLLLVGPGRVSVDGMMKR